MKRSKQSSALSGQIYTEWVEDFQRSILDNSLDCIKVMDLKGNMLYMNDPGLSGMDIDNFELWKGKPWLELWQKKYHPAVRKAIREARQGKSSRFVGYTPTMKGAFKWWDSVVSPIRDKEGKIYRLLNVSRDISERKRIEQRARNSQLNLAFMADASTALASSLDYHTTLQRVATIAVPHICDWCGIDMIDQNGGLQQVAIAHKDKKMIKWARKYRREHPPELDEKTGTGLVIKTKKSVVYPVVTDEMLQAAAKSSEEYELLVSLNFRSVMIVPIIVDNEVTGIISFISTSDDRLFSDEDLDMAEELANRASLAIVNARLYQTAQNSEQKFKAFVDSNIVGVFVADGDGNIKEANDGFLKTIGYTCKELEAGMLNREKLTAPEYRKLAATALKDLRLKGHSTPWEKEYIKRDGSQVPVLVGSILTDKKTGENISIVLDITERKKLEQRKDEFIGIASHELKTPLTSIKGYVQILERIIEELGNDRALMLVSKTNTYINRMNSLITDLLDVSRIQAGKLQFNMEKFDIQDLVLDGIEAVEPTSDKHKIICKKCINWLVYGDKNRLEQVFMNLLSNAIKYSPEGKRIIVTMQQSDKEIIIGVKDYGIGIPKAHQHKLFKRFYRIQKTADQFSGLGIGLYISAEIIKRHHGEIWLESKEGKGSTFYFSLPLKSEKKK